MWTTSWLGGILFLSLILFVKIGNAQENTVYINGTTLYVNNTQYMIRGIAYSPVPIGGNPASQPYGDYFTPKYEHLWHRDFAMMQKMNANTVRVYGWNLAEDHTHFLDVAFSYNIRVMYTFFIGTAQTHPISTADDRSALKAAFVNEVRRYGDHPGILMYLFGNEVNGQWNEFTTTFSQLNNCNWTFDQCFGNMDTTSPCMQYANCMYTLLFNWIEDNISGAKNFTTRPIGSTFADVDNLLTGTPAVDKLSLFHSLVPSMDFWGMQLYRGSSMSTYLGEYRTALGSDVKPLVLTEFGSDAYNDPCGWPENDNMIPCQNRVDDGWGGVRANASGGFRGCNDSSASCALPGEDIQKSEVLAYMNPLLNDSHHVSLGGIVLSWVDEYWKNGQAVDTCATPCAYSNITNCLAAISEFQPPGAPPHSCTWKAHITCNNNDARVRDLCGSFNGGTGDRYINEAWFGMNEPTECTGLNGYNLITPRALYFALGRLFGGTNLTSTVAMNCTQLSSCYTCVSRHSATELQNGGCTTTCQRAASGLPPLDDGDDDDGGDGGDNSALSMHGAQSTVYAFISLFLAVVFLLEV